MGHPTMRRFILISTFTALCWCQDLRGPRPEAPPPIIVKVEMPPQNPGMRLLEILLSGIVGASGALIAVWLTTKRNATENEANREHQLKVEVAKAEIAAKHRSEDNRWEFRKDIYVRLMNSASAVNLLNCQILSLRRKLQTSLSDEGRVEITKMKTQACSELEQKSNEFRLAVVLLPLATADAGLRHLFASKSPQTLPRDDSPDYDAIFQNNISDLNGLLAKLSMAGRKELWGDPEPEAQYRASQS